MLDVRACAQACEERVYARAPAIEACAKGHDVEKHLVLNEAASLLGMPACVVAFRPCLLELVARRLHDASAVHDLACLVGAFEEVYPLVEVFLREHFAAGLPADEAHVLALWRIVRAAPHVPRTLQWRASALYRIFACREFSAGMRYLALECYAVQEHLSSAARDALCSAWIGDEPARVQGLDVDARMLGAHEQRRIDDMWEQCAALVLHPTPSPMCLRAEDVSPSLSMLGDMLMPVAHTPSSDPFIFTAGASDAVHRVLLHVGLRIPVVLSGPPASGKTHLLTYLASRLSHPRHGMPPFLSIPLGDQSGVDAKALLGSYVSSSTKPGTFEFVEGALTRAVRAGIWVILEDVDKASTDVLSVLAPLVEGLGPTKAVGARPVLDLGARGKVEAAPGFALLGTRCVRTEASRAMFLSSEHWGDVRLAPPQEEDVLAILHGRFSSLTQWPRDECACLVSAWHAALDASKHAPASTRKPTLRELVQWCARIEALGVTGILNNPVLQDTVFLDACDVFLASHPSLSSPLVHAIARAMSEALHISTERATYALHDRTPDLAIAHAGRVRVGRVELERLVPGAPSIQRYALTRSTLTSMERVAACIQHSEPTLLVGETGTGKTTMVQTLATLVGQPITVVNLSQQTESGDLLGAYKPLDPKMQAADLHNVWTRLFERTFSLKRNGAYLDAERKAFSSGKWPRLAKLWSESCRMAQKELAAQSESRKKRRTSGTLEAGWQDLAQRVASFTALFASGQRHFAFSFVEGPLVRAVREGHWILLDEVNLASPETLDCLAPLLQSPHGSIVLTERGDLTPIPRHPHFRLFACMNPATDVGKRDLPPSVRARFTEVYIPSPDADMDALMSIVAQYIGQEAVGDKSAVMDVAELYTDVRRAAARHELADGTNQRPHYSVRTLARALTFAASLAPVYGLRRAIAEGVHMAFGMLLDAPSSLAFGNMVTRHILARTKDRRVQRAFVPPAPGPNYVQIGSFWLEAGPLPPDDARDYVLTPSVDAKVGALARALITRQSPVLIQGPTSAGKTSAVEYLARRTGHRFVRINNHEHTDVQEYLGAYASNADGQLVFTEGLLVTALRRGDWLVLDELNLAPTDVLEALNRLLDDNRELLIPETGEVVRPHPHFMLFATQNPPGAYAGRKMLSRAFRNRFVELHFDDVPQSELVLILTTRCAIPPSWAEKIVAVFAELQRRRESGRVFERHAFATLRDLFRWGMREAQGYQQLAETGYMLLAERTRHPRDSEAVRDVLQQVMRVNIEPDALYDRAETLEAQLGPAMLERLRAAAREHHIVWTSAMRRLVCLTAAALHRNEPVLLVGETGAGKTSVCDILATAFGRPLHSFNCHQNTDSADLLGGQRPVRNRAALAAEARAAASQALGVALDDVPLEQVAAQLRAAMHTHTDALQHALTLTQNALALFTWCDGPLVEAMRHGDFMLLDEISLADDSVLERLNSVLERERTLVLAEKAGTDVVMAAQPGFQIIATMNPGGDYGKKELSPALRNRFTEIYVPPVDRATDQAAIVDAILPPALHAWTSSMLTFVQWFAHQLGGHEHTGLGVRDLVGWAIFLRDVCERGLLSPPLAFAHGAALTIIDALGTLPATAAMSNASLHALRIKCYHRVNELIAPAHLDPLDPSFRAVHDTPHALLIGPFAMPKGPAPITKPPFLLQAPTTADNALRVLRACTVRGRSVLLEGSPGAGKTSLIASVAAMTGHELVRINLSEQTELVDLFGAELPVEHGRPGEFAWRPAAFLDAMQRGAWVLLDEMNLASQTVLEGLNSCLDHRGSVYVADIGRTFTKHPDFRLFAAQNPQHQGGARKGLPKSLLNRFIKVYVAELKDADIRIICEQLFPDVAPFLDPMVSFHAALHRATLDGSIGRHGAPWELNLRDQLRWLQVMHAHLGLSTAHPVDALRFLYVTRFRTEQDRQAVAALFAEHFGCGAAQALRQPPALVSPTMALVGHVELSRSGGACAAPPSVHLLPTQLACLEGMAASVRLSMLTIIAGYASAGKSSLVRAMAAMAGMHLEEVRLSTASDTMDVLGSFEQYDPAYTKRDAAQTLQGVVRRMQERSALGDGDALSTLDAYSVQDDPASAQHLLPFADASEAAVIHAELDRLNTPPSAGGQFVWVDGPLVRAAKHGHWLLLDNANLCAASVLDRLNSLFEPNGTLVLSERGMVEGAVQQIQPHPSFRVFMTVDPRHGELSRAMRNRGMELWLEPMDPNRLAPSARSLGGRGTLVDLAVNAHAQRRGMQADAQSTPWTPVRAAAAQSVLNAGMPGAAFITAIQEPALAEAAHVYAAQALTPSERALVRDMYMPAHGGDGVLPADVRRHPDMQGDVLLADTIELSVRSHLRATSLQQPPENSLLRMAIESPHDVPHLARHVPALLEACVELAQVQPPNAYVATKLGSLLDTVHFLERAFHGTELDYSLVHVMLRTLRTTMTDLAPHIQVPARLPALLRQMHAPQTQHSGVAMQALWAHILPTVQPSMLTLLSKLEAHLCEALPPSQAKTALHVLSTLYVCDASWTEAQCAELVSLATSLLDMSAPAFEDGLPFMPRILPVLLWTLANDRAPRSGTRLAHLVHLFAKHSSVPVPLVVGTQLAAWSPTSQVPPALQMRWARALWYSSGAFSIDAPGAHALGHAVVLPAVLDAVHTDRVALSAWPAFDAHLQDLASSVATALVPAQPPRLCMLHDMLKAFVVLVSSALYNALDGIAWPELRPALDRFQQALRAGDHARMAEVTRAVASELSDAAWSAALEAWLTWLERTHAVLGTHSTQADVGAAWIRLALCMLHLYLPDVPLDPVAEVHADHAYRMATYSRLSSRVHVETQAEEFRTGGRTNAVIQSLQAALSDMASRLHQSEHARVDRTPKAALLQRLHAELVGFATQVISPARVERLVSLMAGGDASAEEASLQASLHAFEQRLLKHYMALHDLTAPVLLAMEQLRLGVRLCLPSQPVPERKERLLEASMQFPTSHAAHAVLTQATGPRSVSTAIPELLAALASAAYEAKTTSKACPSDTVKIIYEQLYILWAKQRETEREKAEAQAKVFSYKDEEASEEQAKLDAEIRALFPVYEDVLEAPSVAPAAETPQLSHDVMVRVLDLHMSLFPSGMAGFKRQAPGVHDMLVEAHDALLRSASSVLPRMRMEMDRTGAFQLARIARRRAPLARSNFYHDAQPSEISRMIPILDRLRTHAMSLLQTMPEQVQLQQLVERCDKMAALDVASPVAKGLAAIEVLLTHVDDWETYASRDTSLRAHAAELTELVIEWRRLELHGWKTLLDDEAASEEAAVAPWFFSLYEAMTRSAHTSSLPELVSLLDTFVRSSTTGQLRMRLALLASFSTFLQEGPKAILHNTAAYYAQFLPAIDAHVAQQREILDREIADFVKLASWKDLNVYALKQSAQKTHAYLHKSLRKFREVLRQPADPLLAFKADARPPMAIRPLLGVAYAPYNAPHDGRRQASTAVLPLARAPHLLDMSRTIRHLDELSVKSLLPSLKSERYTDVVDFATSILETADALAQQTPPVSNESNIKLIKSLANQKRRAWTELLKTLRRMGLSPFVTAELLAENRNPVHVYGVPVLAPVSDLGFDAVSQYYAAMLAQAERLRLASQHAQGDVPDLVRGVAFVEHSVQMALKIRYKLSHFCDGAQHVWALTKRLLALRGSFIRVDETFARHVQERVHVLARCGNALEEIMCSAPMHAQASPVQSNVDLMGLQAWLERVRVSHASLATLCTALETQVMLCTEAELNAVEHSTALLTDIASALRHMSSVEPAVALMTVPTCEWLEQVRGHIPCVPQEEHAENVQASSDKVCSSILVIAQELHKAPVPESTSDLADRLLTEETSRLNTVDRILRPQAVAQAVRDALTHGGAGPVTQACVMDMSQFLVTYAEWLWTHVSCVSLWDRSMMRLALVLSVIMTSLATKGFCQPPEEAEGEDDNDAEGGEQLEGGTGLGDGAGAKDVSDTLQDDETMEELKNEDKPEEDENNASKGEDKAREMDDMDGDVHSVDGDNEQEGDENDEEQEQEAEDEVGDIDPLDPDAVDEKMWGDEPEKEAQGESETQGGAQDDREQAGDRTESQDQDGDVREEGDDEQEEAEVEEMPELNDGLGRELDQEAKEEDMQLGDDLDMGEEENEDGDRSGEEDTMSELPEDTQEDEIEDTIPADDTVSKGDQEDAEDHGAEAQEAAQDEDQEGGGNDDMDSAGEDAKDEETNDENVNHAGEDAKDEDESMEAQQQDRLGDKSQPAVQQDFSRKQDAQGAQGDMDAVPEEYDATHEGGGEDAGGAAGQQDRASGDAGQQDGSASAQDQGAQQDVSEQAASGEDAAEAQPNPTQSIGDSLEQFRRDVESIREATHREDMPKREEGMPEPSEVEHIAHDEEADTQALGAADEQQAQAMQNLSVEDADAGETTVMPDQDDVEMHEPEAPESQPEADGAGAQPRGAHEGALMSSDVHHASDNEGDVPSMEEHMDPMADEERVETDQHVAEELDSFRASDADIDKASELWRSYSALTSDLAFSLCEQLRLILAPTLATRLNGDYRTGKRLNMRKIIPFIASDFAKDKIWLRRTKPSAREYQVLLAIDDSKSMAESRNIHLAYQTLSLVAGALTRLEIGDIGICRFGSQMQMLHDFGATTFTDRQGGQILSHLQFEQTTTDMHALLEQSMRVLRDARERHASASAADLWQLEIIISDGVCQNHERLRALLRRAAEERIMIVFVIVDACGGPSGGDGSGQRSSILAMNQVSYHTDAAGKLQLEMKHYIDTFPFDYYVIVRDVQSLPQVLATTLCQWAERIRDA